MTGRWEGRLGADGKGGVANTRKKDRDEQGGMQRSFERFEIVLVLLKGNVFEMKKRLPECRDTMAGKDRQSSRRQEHRKRIGR